MMWEGTAGEKVNAWETVLLSTFQVESVSEIHSKPKGRLLLEKLARIGTINFVRPCSVNPLASHRGLNSFGAEPRPCAYSSFFDEFWLSYIYAKISQNRRRGEKWRCLLATQMHVFVHKVPANIFPLMHHHIKTSAHNTFVHMLKACVCTAKLAGTIQPIMLL